MNCKLCILNKYNKLFSKLRLFSTSFSPPSKFLAFKKNLETDTPDFEKQKSLRIAIVGCPNVGKSSLTNRLIKANVCAVSKLVDTTRENTTTTITENDCQLEIIDSPGLIGLGHAKRLIGGIPSDSKILVDPEKAIQKAEHILVVADATALGKYLHHKVMHLLYRYSHIPASLVLNKIDLLERPVEAFELAEILTEGIIDGQPIIKKTSSFGKMGPLLPSKNGTNNGEEMRIHSTIKNTDELDEEWHAGLNRLLQKPMHRCSWSETRRLFLKQNGWPHFKGVYFVSSLNGNGIDVLRNNLLGISQINERGWKYEKSAVSAKDPRKISIEQIRSEFMNRLPANVAYSLWPQTSHWEIEEDPETGEKMLNIAVNIHCDKKHWARLVTRIADDMEMFLIKRFESLFHMNVRFKMYVKFAGKMYLEEEEKDIKTKKYY